MTSPKLKSPRLDNALEGCEFRPKKIAATPASKRKLFTHRYDEDENRDGDVGEEQKENRSNNMDDDISRIHDDTLQISVPKFLLPKPVVDKKLQKVMATEAGIPKPPKPVETKVQTTVTPRSAVKTATSPRKKKEEQTYGFLQSLDGESCSHLLSNS